MSLWSRIKELFSYDEPKATKPRRSARNHRTVSQSEFTPKRSGATRGGDRSLPLHTSHLSDAQAEFVNSQEMQNLYRLAYERKRISYHQRRNARRLLVDQYADAGIDFYDVFDYEQWKQDMGYSHAA